MTVNRAWREFFGTGIVRTAGDTLAFSSPLIIEESHTETAHISRDLSGPPKKSRSGRDGSEERGEGTAASHHSASLQHPRAPPATQRGRAEGAERWKGGEKKG